MISEAEQAIRPPCPSCGSHYVIKSGGKKTKHQLYKCKQCGTTFRGPRLPDARRLEDRAIPFFGEDLQKVINDILGPDNGLRDETIMKELEESKLCPFCGESKVLKNGHKNGKQRYTCWSCRKTFTYSTGKIYKNSHLPRTDWAYMIEMVLAGFTAERIAEELDVSMDTAYRSVKKIKQKLREYEQQRQAGTRALREKETGVQSQERLRLSKKE